MGIFKMKVVVFVLNRYLDSFLPIVYDHRDRALAWRGPAGTYVWLSPHTLLIRLNLRPAMGEINRGGLPDLDPKSRSGFFFGPDASRFLGSGSLNLLEGSG